MDEAERSMTSKRNMRNKGCLSRRRFVQGAAGAAALLAMPEGGNGQTRPTETKTLYFDFSYLPNPSVPIFFVLGNVSYPLTPVSQAPSSVRTKMYSNAFVRAAGPAGTTHVLENAVVPADALQSGWF